MQILRAHRLVSIDLWGHLQGQNWGQMVTYTLGTGWSRQILLVCYEMKVEMKWIMVQLHLCNCVLHKFCQNPKLHSLIFIDLSGHLKSQMVRMLSTSDGNFFKSRSSKLEMIQSANLLTVLLLTFSFHFS